jgi:hypothetical protein
MTRSSFTIPFAVAVTLGAALLGAQQTSPSILGAWQADTPLPTGVVQTFEFDNSGRFTLVMSVGLDGKYAVAGDRLVETVVMPGTVTPRTDTSTIRIAGDSLVVAGTSGSAHTLRRVGSPVPGAAPIVGDWAISVPNGATARYHFGSDGAVNVQARVAEEHGTYSLRGDTLQLSSDRTFQIPATALVSVQNGTLTLTPPNGHGARTFHRVATR